MSRLYWSNLPDAKRPRGGTSDLCSSLTTEDLPIPEYPETSTNSGLPLATTRSKQVSRVSISHARPYNFSGISSRSGEQLHDDCRNRARHIIQPLAWREWLSCDMGVHPFHRIRSRERQATDQHLVKCDAKGIKIAAGIDRTIHASRLF